MRLLAALFLLFHTAWAFPFAIGSLNSSSRHLSSDWTYYNKLGSNKDLSLAEEKNLSSAVKVLKQKTMRKLSSGQNPIDQGFNLHYPVSESDVLIADRAKKSVWKIGNSSSSGTSFAIGSNLFVTNLHVIRSFLENKGEEEVVLSSEGSKRLLRWKSLKAVSASHDLALFETEEHVADYLKISDKPLDLSSGVFYGFGYPDGEWRIIRKKGEASVFPGKIFFPVDHSELAGASGGPVLDEKGRLIGVISAALLNILVVVSSGALEEFISGHLGLSCDERPAKACFSKEIENLKSLADKGSFHAQYELALIHERNGGEFGKILNLLEKAALQSHPMAQVALCKRYQELKEKKSEQLRLANEYQKVALLEVEKMLYCLRKAVLQGNLISGHTLGEMYFMGYGVETDLVVAKTLFQHSGEQGYVLSQFSLAVIYLLDYVAEGEEKSKKMAFKWAQKAAKKNFVRAQLLLSQLYFGDEKEQEACLWLNKALISSDWSINIYGSPITSLCERKGLL